MIYLPLNSGLRFCRKAAMPSLIVGVPTSALQLRLKVVRAMPIIVHREAHDFLGRRQRQGSALTKIARPIKSCALQIACRRGPVSQPKLDTSCCIDPLSFDTELKSALVAEVPDEHPVQATVGNKRNRRETVIAGKRLPP